MTADLADGPRDAFARLHAAAHRERARRRRRAVAVTAAVVTTAVVGSIGTTADSAWFARLDKPSWYPPPVAFPLVWTALYASIGWSATHALNRAPAPGRRRIAASLGVNLALNSAWTWTFFRAQRPGLALATIAALDASNVNLLRTVARHDRPAAAALLPYAAWTAFATALTEELWHRNP